MDVKNRILLAPDGNKLPLSKTQIHWVLGIPIGRKVVQLYDDEDGDDRGEVDEVRGKEIVGNIWVYHPI